MKITNKTETILTLFYSFFVFREEPSSHGALHPELQAGAASPQGVHRGRGQHLQARRVEVETASGTELSN